MAEQRSPHVKINLRIAPGLHKKLVQEVKRKGTTLQEEITARLEFSFNPDAEAMTASFNWIETLKNAGYVLPPLELPPTKVKVDKPRKTPSGEGS